LSDRSSRLSRPLGDRMSRILVSTSGVILINTRNVPRLIDEHTDRVVARHRDEPSPALPVDWGILRLLDERHCRGLQHDLADWATEWEVQRATPDLHKSLPDEAGLYMFVWRPPFEFEVAEQMRAGGIHQIIYVGQAGGAGNGSANTLRLRYRDYQDFLKREPSAMWAEPVGAGRRDVLSRYLTLRPLEYWFSIVKDRARIVNLERRLIQLLNPPGNITGGPVLRPSRPVPALRPREGD
jgi:hypothetical protein